VVLAGGFIEIVRRSAADRLDPVELDVLGLIQGSSGLVLAKLINQMLMIDSGERLPASDLLVPWQSVFLAVAKRARALEGRVF